MYSMEGKYEVEKTAFAITASAPGGLVNQVKQPSPSYLGKKASLAVPRHPDKNSFADNMIFGNKSPETRIK